MKVNNILNTQKRIGKISPSRVYENSRVYQECLHLDLTGNFNYENIQLIIEELSKLKPTIK